MKQTGITYLLLAVVLGVSLYFRFIDFNHNIENPHSFRQSHTAGNIHFFIKNGLSLEGESFSKNGPGKTINQYKVFDIPFYQHIVAIACKTFKTDIIPTGRAVNILIFVGSFFTLYGIMGRCGFSRRCTLLSLLFFGLSPLNIYYNRAILPDNLAVLLSFISLHCFLIWNEHRDAKPTAFVFMIASGVIATWIKSPVYLPVAITVGWFVLLHKKSHKLFTPKILIYFGTIGMAVVSYRLYSNMVNTGSIQSLPWENIWYFGRLEDRWTHATYVPIFERFFFKIVPPAISTLFMGGLALVLLDKQQWTEKRSGFAVMTGLFLGAILTILIFLNVNKNHSYYQIPFVFIICFFSGYCADVLLKILNTLAETFTPPWRTFAKGTVYVMLAVFTLQSFRMFHYTATEPMHQIEPGRWLQAHTPEDAFILYVTPENTWDHTYLYAAKREGFYIDVKTLNPDAITDAINMFEDSYDDFYLFFPYYLLKDPEVLMHTLNITAHAAHAGYLVKLEKEAPKS